VDLVVDLDLVLIVERAPRRWSRSRTRSRSRSRWRTPYPGT